MLAAFYSDSLVGVQQEEKRLTAEIRQRAQRGGREECPFWLSLLFLGCFLGNFLFG
jgi:hypothetical protein